MRLSAKVFAKLNLYLDVLNKRDDGFHDVDSVMQSISLYDEISITPTDDDEISTHYQDPSFYREDDIVLKACKLFFEFSGFKCGLDIQIIKNIPTVAGLGGFSADVAAVLRMLNVISKKNFDDETMLKLCARLGSDVPFCYNGGTARALAVGDELQPLSTVKLYFVIIKDREKQSTGKMYSVLDELAVPPSGKINGMLDGIKNNSAKMVAESVYNIFENCWDFENMTSDFMPFEPDSVLLCGSGPSVTAVFISREKAITCYEALAKKKDQVFYAETEDVGSIIE